MVATVILIYNMERYCLELTRAAYAPEKDGSNVIKEESGMIAGPLLRPSDHTTNHLLKIGE